LKKYAEFGIIPTKLGEASDCGGCGDPHGSGILRIKKCSIIVSIHRATTVREWYG